jgi:hypothetical protein
LAQWNQKYTQITECDSQPLIYLSTILSIAKIHTNCLYTVKDLINHRLINATQPLQLSLHSPCRAAYSTALF